MEENLFIYNQGILSNVEILCQEQIIELVGMDYNIGCRLRLAQCDVALLHLVFVKAPLAALFYGTGSDSSDTVSAGSRLANGG